MDYRNYIAEQQELAGQVITADQPFPLNIIGGCDSSFANNKIFSAVVVLDPQFRILEKATVVMELNMPYIPGLLFYREGRSIIEAYKKLTIKPDVLLVDANGVLHPRRCGMASQLGIALDIATVGVSKNLLVGSRSGEFIKVGDEVLGCELKTRDFSNPIYVSRGHKISLETSLEIVKKCIRYPHKLPEPLHAAHRIAEQLKSRA